MQEVSSKEMKMKGKKQFRVYASLDNKNIIKY